MSSIVQQLPNYSSNNNNNNNSSNTNNTNNSNSSFMNNQQQQQLLNVNTTSPNTNSGAENYDQIFDDDVQRFEATEYKQRYGDRWKKLATSVRDVVQSDGTIIREYVIEDPSLLEQLSEDEENNVSNMTNSKPISDKLNTSNSFIGSGTSSLPLLKNNVQISSSFKTYNNSANNTANSTIKDMNENNNSNNKEKYFQPIISSNKKDEEEFDKEVENIHEQGN